MPSKDNETELTKMELNEAIIEKQFGTCLYFE